MPGEMECPVELLRGHRLGRGGGIAGSHGIASQLVRVGDLSRDRCPSSLEPVHQLADVMGEGNVDPEVEQNSLERLLLAC
jgi:hypothetical protein